MYETSAQCHFDPTTATSLLEDLPVKKPRNSYSHVTSEGIQLLPGEDGSRRENHRFLFPFFKIGAEHVLKINDVFLENAYRTSKIAFNSSESLKQSIQHYFQLPSDRGFKSVHRRDKDARLTYLRKLETILRSLGSETKLVYREILGMDAAEGLKDETLKALLKEGFERAMEQPTDFMQLYNNLGKHSASTVTEDI
jgi:hypothetical protein